MKIAATLGVISIWGHQNDGRNLERGRTPGQRNVHALDESTPLYGFGGSVIHALGKVVLPVSFGTVQNARTEYLSFDVVEMYYPYNGSWAEGSSTSLRQSFTRPICA
jgi:hypothetical protein